MLGSGVPYKLLLVLADAEGWRGDIVAHEMGANSARCGALGREAFRAADYLILLVEDREDVRRILQIGLGRQGFRVLAAASGPEGLVLAAKASEPVDLLVTDIVMPRMNGREVAEELHRHHPAAKVLFVSGCAADDLRRNAVDEAAVAFLRKPFTPRELAAKVREVLESSSAERGR